MKSCGPGSVADPQLKPGGCGGHHWTRWQLDTSTPGGLTSLSNASPEQKNLGWKVVNAASMAVAADVTQRVLTTVWRLVRHEPPPSGPADRRVTWGAALTWASSLAVGIAVSRVVAVRLSGKVWEAAVHEPPPEAPS